MAFFHSGRVVLTAPADPDPGESGKYYVRLWDVASGRMVGQTGAHDRGVYMVAVSEDDRFILTGTGDFNFRGRNLQSVYLWDARTLRLIDQRGGQAWTNADRVSDEEIEHLLRSNGVRIRPPQTQAWAAERLGESVTAVMRASVSQEKHVPGTPHTWLPIVPTNAETP